MNHGANIELTISCHSFIPVFSLLNGRASHFYLCIFDCPHSITSNGVMNYIHLLLEMQDLSNFFPFPRVCRCLMKRFCFSLFFLSCVPTFSPLLNAFFLIVPVTDFAHSVLIFSYLALPKPKPLAKNLTVK